MNDITGQIEGGNEYVTVKLHAASMHSVTLQCPGHKMSVNKFLKIYLSLACHFLKAEPETSEQGV